jgi:hypothetical protein
MAATGFITTAELNFDTYRANLKTYLQSQAQFKDYNFDGSNFAVLLDVLAYNTYMNAFYMNMIGSEMFLDTSTLFESAYSHAKELNYTPSSRSSSAAVVTITLTGLSNTAAYVTIPKNYRISTKVNSKNYLFATNESHTISRTTGFTSANISIYEGKVTTEYFTEANTAASKTRYVLASANLDTSSIDVQVKSSVSTNTFYTYTEADTLYGLTSTSNVYFVQGYGAGKYEIVFGNGVTGASLISGNIVKVNYRDCLGTEGDYAGSFTALDTAYADTGEAVQSNGIRISTVHVSSGGSDRESVESIKFNAPRYYATQDRAVTKEDYTSLIKAKFPSIQSVTVFGGEENTPKQYGKVILVTKSFGSDKTPDSTKLSIQNYLREKMPLSIIPIFQEPDYIYVKVNTTVYYNPSLTTKTTSDIKSAVISAISTYSSTNLQNFNQNMRFSRLTAAIDASDTSVLANDTVVQMAKRLIPTINTAYSTEIYFHNPIYLTTSINDSSINSSIFFINLNGVVTAANIKDDGSGLLYVVTASTQTAIGTIDYTIGKLVIANLTVAAYNNYISLYAYTASQQDIIIQRDQILTIDPAEVTITVETALS